MAISELQMALLGAGAVAVVGVFGFSKWQESRHRRKAEEAFGSDHRDVLLEPTEHEPAAETLRVEPASDEEPPLAAPLPESKRPVSESGERRASPEQPDALDERVDSVIRIESIEALPAPKIWAAQKDQLAGLNRSVAWFGFDDASNDWEPLSSHSAGQYNWFCVAMQMVDRRGPVSDAEFARFCDGVHRVCDQFLAVPASIPVRSDAVARAAELDRFCAGVDVQIGVNIVSTGQPFAGTKVRALAESQGLVLRDDGMFHAEDEDANTLFSLGNLEPTLFASAGMRALQTNGLTLVVDVPRVARGGQVFDRMMTVAHQMADALGGKVVDDNRNAFGDQAAGMIRGQIEQFQQRMQEFGLPAGSPLALRLFAA